jgi:hypothetical protein
MLSQEIQNLLLLASPIFLIQLGLAIFALVDLAKRKRTHGPRWLWAVLLVLTCLAVPSGFIVIALYLLWGRQVEAPV